MFEKDKIKDLIKYFPPFLILIGIIKLYIFYQRFGINIIEYISLTEALIAFNDEIIYLFFFIILPAAVLIGMWGNPIAKENNELFNYQLHTSFKERIKKDIKTNTILKTMYLVSIAFSLIAFFRGTYNELTFVALISFCNIWLIHFIIREIRISHFKNNKEHISVTYINLLTLCSTLFSIVIINAFIEVYSIKYNLKFYGTQLEVNNGTVYRSDSTLTYVGKTANYVFFSNLKNSEALIIPCSKINILKLRTK